MTSPNVHKSVLESQVINRACQPFFMMLAILFCIQSNTGFAACTDENGRCLLGVFPHSSMKQVEETYSTIAEELSLILDRDVIVNTSSTTSKYIEKLIQGKYDIVLIGPGHYSSHGKTAGYIPLARRELNLRFQLITLSRNGIRTLGDIKEKRLGLQPKTSGSYLTMMQLLEKNGIHAERDTEVFHFTSHQACIHALITNKVDICGIAHPVKAFFELKLDLKFKVLATSQEIPNVAYAVHPRLGDNRINEIREYLLAREGYVPATREEYDFFDITLPEQIDVGQPGL